MMAMSLLMTYPTPKSRGNPPVLHLGSPWGHARGHTMPPRGLLLHRHYVMPALIGKRSPIPGAGRWIKLEKDRGGVGVGSGFASVAVTYGTPVRRDARKTLCMGNSTPLGCRGGTAR